MQLNEDALAQFNKKFRDWDPYKKLLLETFSPKEKLSILDIGGGNGYFLDKLLETIPSSTGTLIDNSKYMIRHNVPNVQKKIILDSALSFVENSSQTYDLIIINVFLHHLIEKNDVETYSLLSTFLSNLKNRLKSTGKIFIYEQVYNGYYFDPGFIIYYLTKNRNFILKKIFKILGANTAGIGVRFRAKDSWEKILSNYFDVKESKEIYEDKNIFRKIFLNIKWGGSHLFILEPKKTYFANQTH